MRSAGWTKVELPRVLDIEARRCAVATGPVNTLQRIYDVDCANTAVLSLLGRMRSTSREEKY